MTETIRIKYPANERDGYANINRRDFDPAVHQLFDEDVEQATVAAKDMTRDQLTLRAQQYFAAHLATLSDADLLDLVEKADARANKPAGEPPKTDVIDIPANWHELHWKTQVALAEKIAGRTDVDTAAAARQVIEAELKRRAEG